VKKRRDAVCRNGDNEVISKDSDSDSDDDDEEDDDDDDDDITVTTYKPTCQSSTLSAWDLSCAALQVQQSIYHKYRTAPLGNQLHQFTVSFI